MLAMFLTGERSDSASAESLLLALGLLLQCSGSRTD
jgi:hypothetical protein